MCSRLPPDQWIELILGQWHLNRSRSDEVGQMQSSHERIDLSAAVSARVERAQDRSDAGAHDEVGSYARAIENLHYADVGQPSRSPTGKHESGLPLWPALLRQSRPARRQQEDDK
jgi:hypothetical protein